MNRPLTFAALALFSTAVMAHAKLQSSSPASSSTVSPSPTELRLSYNEPVETVMSSIRLIGPDGTAIPVDKPTAAPADGKTLVLQHLPKLSAGHYRVQWSTMGRDGHHTQGEFSFVVK